MKQSLYFLAKLYLCFISIFLVGKLGFLTYNHAIDSYTLSDVWAIWWNGLPMDLSVCGYLVILPWLCCLIGLWWHAIPIRKILSLYWIIASLAVIVIIGVDMALYEHWKFKINASIFSYMANLGGAANSVSEVFIFSVIGAFILFSAALAYLLIHITPSRGGSRHRCMHSLAWVLIGGVIFLLIRGGISTAVMNIGSVYYCQKLFYNHAAVNPLFSLLASVNKSKSFKDEFRFMEQKECDSIFDTLYTKNTGTDIQDTLLNNQRPQILWVFMESFGSRFVEELGGVKQVAPELSKLIPEGIFWNNYYSNSFRTDRGTVCAYSGHISYPTASLMRLPEKMQYLPGIGKSLQQAGYQTHYIYGGDISIMGKKSYLLTAGFSHLVSDKDFDFLEVKSSKWGANDSITAQRAYDLIAQEQLGEQWMLALQTLNSHEPFEVPYHKFEDKVLNAFAYTDACIGRLITQLKMLPVWDNLLIILVPDHGFLYQITYEDPAFFHCPMLWLGGAIKNPSIQSILMNQSDLCATLLAQMSLPSKDYTWSRNVLSQSYTHPFVYCSFPSGIMVADSLGKTIYDLSSRQVIKSIPTESESRTQQAKAILQKSYQLLEDMQ